MDTRHRALFLLIRDKNIAPATKKYFEYSFIVSPKGTNAFAKTNEITIDTNVAINADSAIFFITMALIPFFFNKSPLSIIGVDITPPGSPTNIAGIRFIRFKVTIAEIKKLNII